MHPNKLPFFIGIPTKQAVVFPTHAVEWQIQFIDYLYQLGLSVPEADYQHCETFLLYRNISFHPSAEHIKAVENYLNILQRCLISTEEAIYNSKMNYYLMNRLLYSEFLAN